MIETIEAELKKVYRALADHTYPVCASECNIPQSCCDSMYCDITKQWAKEQYGVELTPTQHPTLPFMGPHGCIVEPHLRPLCTLHVCCINGLGYKKDDMIWTDHYFILRGMVDDLEEKRIRAKGEASPS